MPNCLLNCGKMRSKPLRPEVQLGPALTPRVRVNQEPPFVPFKRQLTRERVQRPPRCRIRNVPPTTFDLISHAGSTPRCASPRPATVATVSPKLLEPQSSFDLVRRKSGSEHGSLQLVPHACRLCGKSGSKFFVADYFPGSQISGHTPFEVCRQT